MIFKQIHLEQIMELKFDKFDIQIVILVQHLIILRIFKKKMKISVASLKLIQ